MPEVSVVLPVYNGAATIDRSVRSILEQTLRDFELIIVDDGSTDETVAIVETISDPRLKLIARPRKGVAAATNTGTRLAAAPVIARMDADDFSYAERLEKQLQQLHDDDLDVVGCQVRILDEAGKSASTLKRYERWINEETIESRQILALRFVELPLVNPTILARRRYFEMGFRDNRLPEDYDLMLRAAADGLQFGKVDEILLDWRDGPARLTRTDFRYSLEAFAACRRMHLLDGPLNGVSQVDLWGFGQTGKPWLRWLQGQGISVRRGYEINQRQIGETIHGVGVTHIDDMLAADGTPLIIAVGADGARPLILPHIQSRGFVAGHDAWFVA